MEVRLSYQANLDLTTMEFKDKWAFKVDAKAVHAFNHKTHIECVGIYDGCTTLHLDEIPFRLDLTEDKVLWIMDKKSAKDFPQPYKSLDNEKSETIWIKSMEVKA